MAFCGFFWFLFTLGNYNMIYIAQYQCNVIFFLSFHFPEMVQSLPLPTGKVTVPSSRRRVSSSDSDPTSESPPKGNINLLWSRFFKWLLKNISQRCFNQSQLSKLSNEPIRIPSVFLWLAQSTGKNTRTRCDWFWRCFGWRLIVASFLNNHYSKQLQVHAYFWQSFENCSICKCQWLK